MFSVFKAFDDLIDQVMIDIIPSFGLLFNRPLDNDGFHTRLQGRGIFKRFQGDSGNPSKNRFTIANSCRFLMQGFPDIVLHNIRRGSQRGTFVRSDQGRRDIRLAGPLQHQKCRNNLSRFSFAETRIVQAPYHDRRSHRHLNLCREVMAARVHQSDHLPRQGLRPGLHRQTSGP